MHRAALVTAGECRLVLPIGEFDRREAWGVVGIRSCGGPTALSNLVTLCSRRHHLVHEGGFRLEMERSGRVRVFAADGSLIPSAPKCRTAPPNWREQRLQRAGDGFDAETLAYGGEHFDLGLTIDGLLIAAGKMSDLQVR